MEEKNSYKDFMDYLLSDDKEVYDNGLSHPSIEFEEKERQVADDMLETRLIEYHCCDRFYGTEKLVCDTIKKLGVWLSDKDGLGMKDVIEKILKENEITEDLNPNYQKPLEYLYNTNKFSDIIKKSDGTYYTNRLANCSLLKDSSGNWSYLNKLSVNYNDLAELLTTLFLKGGQIEKLSKMNILEIKNFLLPLKGKTMLKLLTKYFTLEEYEDFIYNTLNNTKVGDYVEDLTKNILQKDGYVLLYEGSNGNFIDMIYGIDLIMEKNGEIVLIQVKSKAIAAKESTTKEKYKQIDLFVGESKDHNGVVLYHRSDNFSEKFVSGGVLEKNMEYLKERYK